MQGIDQSLEEAVVSIWGFFFFISLFFWCEFLLRCHLSCSNSTLPFPGMEGPCGWNEDSLNRWQVKCAATWLTGHIWIRFHSFLFRGEQEVNMAVEEGAHVSADIYSFSLWWCKIRKITNTPLSYVIVYIYSLAFFLLIGSKRKHLFTVGGRHASQQRDLWLVRLILGRSEGCCGFPPTV